VDLDLSVFFSLSGLLSVVRMSAPPEFLTTVLAGRDGGHGRARPWVTLTFAQSLDAKIAGVGGKQLILSGRESMVMTHWCSMLVRGRVGAVLMRGKDADAARWDPRRDRHRHQR
jgi:hypothetical protein